MFVPTAFKVTPIRLTGNNAVVRFDTKLREVRYYLDTSSSVLLCRNVFAEDCFYVLMVGVSLLT